ncbi:lipid-A-disaccharide synthase [Phormidium pseudopriestleyi FRX01]|uniref:Lipid-A-disaccharide synthase n=1 Tax=Phormidium pseudopriestleyi FRX01 TaxID=1759528 RepID=A0ABS3FN09_9CYAN|nr:lipid-A-disaccharide synthase [Phormidium pseudopriestleyi]MBO0348499.1 lipid-A-disaccharide synthase [Phormidium pseudopriestleyi FRX01]
MATIFISTGEVSGDMQGAMLVEALYRQAQSVGIPLEIMALGGAKMAQAGAVLLGDTTGIGSVGILESLPYIWPTLQIQRCAKAYLRNSPPDVIILIDYLGPNLGIGNFAKEQVPQVPRIYYIAPQEWVWSLGDRTTTEIVRLCDRLLAIFPTEARYYQEHGAVVDWVGHPFIDVLQNAPTREMARQTLGIESDELAIALLPASRQQELRYLLPVMFEAAQQIQTHHPSVQFYLPLSWEKYRPTLETEIQRYGLRAKLVEANQSRMAIAAADLAITKSGTVNLEIALLNVPQVVIYRVNPLTAWIARHLLKFSIPFMSAPNLVLMKSIVPELLQESATTENIVREALDLLENPKRREQMQQDYQQMRDALGEPGVCDRAAQIILGLVKS